MRGSANSAMIAGVSGRQSSPITRISKSCSVWRKTLNRVCRKAAGRLWVAITTETSGTRCPAASDRRDPSTLHQLVRDLFGVRWQAPMVGRVVGIGLVDEIEQQGDLRPERRHAVPHAWRDYDD